MMDTENGIKIKTISVWGVLCLIIYPAVLIFNPVFAQLQNSGGGEYIFSKNPCLSTAQYEQIYSELQESERLLAVQGKLPAVYRTSQVLLSFPLRQAAGFNYPSFYGISNYVDHDPNVVNQIQDYNCGTRSYDVSSGYNHQGTDYFLWPFDNLMQERNQVEVIAAADGVILNKIDGNPDQSCSFCTGCQWNAVYLRHNDGSVSWYGHLKKNSLTSKAVGLQVQRGEYLGVVGSSGISTSPHLHFEVYRSTNYSLSNLIDPYAGSCNRLNGTSSWWEKQPSYTEPRIALIQTQSAATVFNNCPVPEVSYEARDVVPGQTVYFTAYYNDQQPGTVAQYEILRPDGTTFRSWSQNFTNYYSASWWWWSYTLPNIAPSGQWIFRTTYAGKTVNYPFRVDVAAGIPGETIANLTRVYPNPFSSEIVIDLNKMVHNGQIRISDLSGRLLLAKPISKNTDRKIRLQGLNLVKGVYRLTIEENGRILAVKMLLSEGAVIE
jgi:hypothetical protein